VDAITPRQQEFLNFVESRISLDGKSPTLEQIRKFFGLASNNSVRKNLDFLQKKGALVRPRYRHHGILPTQAPA
jgi:SOS-response transcriptional repressor LexA